MSPRPPLRASRRAAVTGGLLLAPGLAGALSACDPGSLVDPDDPPGSADAAPSGADPDLDPDLEPDEVLLDEVRTELDELVALTTALGRRQPELRGRVAPLLAMHVAHREALVERGSVPAPVPAPRASAPTGSPAELGALLVRREREGRRRLAAFALRAESGALARLLASMAAGTAAHLTVLQAAR